MLTKTPRTARHTPLATRLAGAYRWADKGRQFTPDEVGLIYDYGYADVGLTGEAVRAFDLHAGTQRIPTIHTASTRAYRSTTVGKLLVRGVRSPNTTGKARLFVGNAAAGNNKPNGTHENVRELFLGAVFANGDVVTFVDSDNAARYVAGLGTHSEPVAFYDIPIKPGSQIRGRDDFPVESLDFFDAAKRGIVNQKYKRVDNVEPLHLTDADLAQLDTEVVFNRTTTLAQDGHRTFVVTDQPEHQDRQGVSVIAAETDNPLGAGFLASQIGLGGQLDQVNAPPVPALIVVDIDTSQYGSEVPVYAQKLPHGVWIVGPGVAEVWQTSSRSQVWNTGRTLRPGESIRDVANDIFAHGLSRAATKVDRNTIALPDEELHFQDDGFGNEKRRFPFVHKLVPGQKGIYRTSKGNVPFSVIKRFFDLPQSKNKHDDRGNVTEWDSAANGLLIHGSSGGWDVYVAGKGWQVFRVSEFIHRVNRDQDRSFASVLGKEQRPNGRFVSIETNTRSTTEILARSASDGFGSGGPNGSAHGNNSLALSTAITSLGS